MGLAGVTESYGFEVLPQPAALSVHSFAGREALGVPYRFEVVFTSVTAGLARDAVLGRPARFTIAPTGVDGMGPARVWHGIVTRFETLGRSRDETRYRAVLEPRISDLGLEVTSRLFQNQSVPQIIEAVLRRFGLTSADYSLRLRGDYAPREYTTQYQETSLAFVQRLAADEGIWWRIDNNDEREVVVFGDDLDAYARPGLDVPYREDAGLEAGGAQAIRTLGERATRVPRAVVVNDYNHRTASVALLREGDGAPGDATTGPAQTIWGPHHPTPQEGDRVALLRHQAHLAGQILFDGTGNVHALAAGTVFTLADDAPADAPNGLLATWVEHGGARGEAYANRFGAIPADRVYRPPVDPSAWPNIAGVIPARITSPGNYQYAYIGPEGWYRVKLPFDLDSWSPGGSSRPVRLARPYAGADYGHHFPLIDGTEVALAFTCGDPDRPIIVGSLHDSDHGDHVTNLNNTRNIVLSAARNQLRMEDRRDAEHVHLGSPFATSELNLGSIANDGFEQRGQGVELRSDDPVVVRSGQGVLLSAEGQPAAQGRQQAMDQTQRHLAGAHAVLASLADAAGTASALRAELDRHEALLQQLATLQRQVLLATGPAGVGITSGDGLTMTATREASLIAGGALDLASGAKVTVAAAQAISLFAASQGAQMIAGQGPVTVEAQQDRLQIAAQQDVTVASVEGKVIVTAPNELWIGAGGSYIKLTNTGIEIASPGEILAKTTQIIVTGPASEKKAFPIGTRAYDEKYQLFNRKTGKPMPCFDYRIENAEGRILARGTTDRDGYTLRLFTSLPEGITIMPDYDGSQTSGNA